MDDYSEKEVKVAKKKRKLNDKASAEELKVDDWRDWRKQKKEQTQQWRDQNILKKCQKQNEKLQKENEKLQKQKELKENVNKIASIHGRKYSVSIAVPGSIMKNAQSQELRTILAGQIARAAVIFNVDEIVVFDDQGISRLNAATDDEDFTVDKSCASMGRILQFLECPQYLRKTFFPLHADLKFVGLLPPLDCPHHLRADEESPFREGVVTKRMKQEKGSYVNVGLVNQEALIDKVLQPGIRVTVRMLPRSGKKLQGLTVDANTPRLEQGIYWGYNVRLAESLGAVFSGCPYDGGYDVTIGTSDKGNPIDDVRLEPFNHLLVIFGGLNGLEASIMADERLVPDHPKDLFDHYVNACTNQGSRTIRTEEAILITLSALRSKITKAGASQTE